MAICFHQFVEDVTDYSSQYGSLGSISYVSSNIKGGISLYPEYGDFPGSFSMQTYGKWWKVCPSASPNVLDSCMLMKPSMDFIDVVYEFTVHVERVNVYEVFNPGSVVKIWGSLKGRNWVLLWTGSPTMEEPISRVFSPTLRPYERGINALRIEFDQGNHQYHCGFEAILMEGSLLPSVNSDGNVSHRSLSRLLSDKVIILENNVFTEENIKKGAEFLCNELKSLDCSSSSLSESESQSDTADGNFILAKGTPEPVLFESAREKLEGSELQSGYFGWLPEELILLILKQIDLQSLCRLGCTCRNLKQLTSAPILYQNLNLKNCWWMVTDGMLKWLSPRSGQLRGLDLSWCGPYEAVSPHCFMEFVNTCGQNLTILHLCNCQFVDNYSLYIIANTCLILEVLSLSGCDKIDHLGFGELKKLTSLKYLDLSRTKIEFGILHVLLQSMDSLQHLKLHHCHTLDLDLVTQAVATFNRSLVSLGAWKARGLTIRGFRSLASLNSLQELDVGWAIDRNTNSITEGLDDLLQANSGLRKLFLTSYRGLSEDDIQLLAIHGNSLEQLDIMGSRNISPDSVLRLLSSCQTLQLIDVSYCEQIDSGYITLWRARFPSVSIKGGQKNYVSLL